MSLHQQGANRGAVTSFLISTPESGADSIAITYALLDPFMTVLRPVAAFLTAFTAGIAANLTDSRHAPGLWPQGLSVAAPGDRRPASAARPGPLGERLKNELRFAFTDFWGDLAGAFFIGVLLAGLIAALIPEHFFAAYLGGGIGSMLVMLVAGIPLYICATASTPIAAALIMKGVSPGAALVFLLAGPATNAAAVAVVLRALGRRTTLIYLTSIAGCALMFGLLVDVFYTAFDLSARAVAGEAAETIPRWLALACAIVLLVMTFASFWQKLQDRIRARSSVAGGPTAGVEILPYPENDGPRSRGPT